MKNKKSKKKLSMETSRNTLRYLENLRAVLEGARREYQQQTIDWRNAQLAHLRNYMWTAATLFAFESGLVLGVLCPGKGLSLPWHVEPSPLFRLLAAAALCSCSFAFLYALDACRGRRGIMPPCDRLWTSVADIAWDEKTGKHTTGMTLVTMIAALEKACREHQKQNGERAKKLRLISVILLTSSGLAALFLIPW